MDRLEINVMGIAECRSTGPVKVTEESGHTYFYPDGDSLKHGVGRLLDKNDNNK